MYNKRCQLINLLIYVAVKLSYVCKSLLLNFLLDFQGARRSPEQSKTTTQHKSKLISNIRLIKYPLFDKSVCLVQETYGKKKYSWTILQITSTNKNWQCSLRGILLVICSECPPSEESKIFAPQTVLIPTAILNLKRNIIPTVPMFGSLLERVVLECASILSAT